MASKYPRKRARVIPQHSRLEQRERPGDLDSLYHNAIDESKAGNAQNAWALLYEALGVALQRAWLAMPGHSGGAITDKQRLLIKLRSSGRIDQWTHAVALTAIAKPPREFTLRQCDLLAAIVRVFAFDLPAKPREQAPAEEKPEHRDPRQTEHWLPLPAVEPAEPRDTRTGPSETGDKPPTGGGCPLASHAPRRKGERPPRRMPTSRRRCSSLNCQRLTVQGCLREG
ncbi:MAG: hypothetical protein DCC67_11510 [Planctomycetota bacterium]|nr:MAG: hypothetical protein DCC67_11510 [Planctomycetota bacterium]